jgi:DNA-binding response OmpR family regulator
MDTIIQRKATTATGESLLLGAYFVPRKESVMDKEKKRILLVDDEEVILFGFKQVLSEPWLQVDTADTKETARLLAETNVYAAAILDLRLSNSTALEGLELIPVVKNTQKNCRIIVVTAYGDEPIKSQALAAGADLFLEKPVSPEAIKKILEDMGIY